MAKDELAERRKQNQIISDIDKCIDALQNSVPEDPDCIDWEEKSDGKETTKEGEEGSKDPEDPEAA